MNEVIELLKTGSWVAFAGFGAYLGYKLALVSVLSFAVVKAINKIVEAVTSARETTHRLYSLIAAANMRWPLSPVEWEELEKRVRQ